MDERRPRLKRFREIVEQGVQKWTESRGAAAREISGSENDFQVMATGRERKWRKKNGVIFKVDCRESNPAYDTQSRVFVLVGTLG